MLIPSGHGDAGIEKERQNKNVLQDHQKNVQVSERCVPKGGTASLG